MTTIHPLALLQHQIDLISVPVFVVDELENREFSIAAINVAHAEISGLDRDAVVGKTPFDLLDDRETAKSVVRHYRDCVTSPGPISYRETIEFGGAAMVFDTTLQKFKRRGSRHFRIVGTSLRVEAKDEIMSDIEFYVSLARNTVITMEMLMNSVATGSSLTVSEREAALILARKALASLDDIERASSRLQPRRSPEDAHISSAVRDLLLH